MRKWMMLVVLSTLAGAASADPSPRAALAAEGYLLANEAFKAGTEPVDTAYQWSLRWLDAMRAGGEKDALAAHLERMKLLETAAKARFEAGTVSKLSQTAAAYFRAEAEEWLGPAGKKAGARKHKR